MKLEKFCRGHTYFNLKAISVAVLIFHPSLALSGVNIVEEMIEIYSKSPDENNEPLTKNIRQNIIFGGAPKIRDAVEPPLTQIEMGRFADALLKFETEDGRSLRLYHDMAAYVSTSHPLKSNGDPIIDGKTLFEKLQHAAALGQSNINLTIEGVELAGITVSESMSYDIGYTGKYGGFISDVTSPDLTELLRNSRYDPDRPHSDYAANCRDAEAVAREPDVYTIQSCNIAGQIKAAEDFGLKPVF